MKKRLNFLLTILFFSFCVKGIKAQKFIIYGDKTFGGDNDDRGMGIIKYSSYEFILTGDSKTDVNGDKTDPLCDTLLVNKHSDIWLLKIDTGFNVLWNNSMGGYWTESVPCMTETQKPKQMIFSCTSGSDSACEKTGHNSNPINYGGDYWICMIDSNGNRIWDKTLGGDDGFDGFPSIIQLTTGDFIVCGESKSPVSGDKTVPNHTYNGVTFKDFWCIKLDSSGNKIWDKVYGGDQDENITFGENPLSLLTCSGGDFILIGITNSDSSYEISSPPKGFLDTWIMKADSAGNKIWDRRFGGSSSGTSHIYPNQIIQTKDGGYILCGDVASPQGGDISEPSRGGADCCLLKLDSMGNKQWDHRYGGSKADLARRINEVSGGYLVGGVTDSDSSYDISENRYGVRDYWIFMIDTLGNKIWDKRFGGPGSNELSDFVAMPDSSIYLFGYANPGTSPVKTDSGRGIWDYWLVHFKYIDTTAMGVGENEYNNENYFTVYPNPANDKLKVSGLKLKVEEIEVFDVVGNLVLQKECKKENEMDVSSLSAGLYFVQVKTPRGVYTQKVIKE